MPRAPLNPELQALRRFLPTLLPILAPNPDWYASVYFEKKSGLSCMANLHQTDMGEDISMGLVLRIYDGYTLHESATDRLDPAALTEAARRLAQRVGAAKPQAGAVLRPYRAASWAERLAQTLETDITSQIPPNPGPDTDVHFGIQCGQDPRTETGADGLATVQGLVARLLERAPLHGLAASDLSYVAASRRVALEESIFIDREVNLSQTLPRLSQRLLAMSGADRTNERVGGLGGLELLELGDALIDGMLSDLAALKRSERIEAGQYRLLVSPGIAGVVAHEAFGHSQEADTCARGRSMAWDLFQSGERVGNPHATILNNPAIYQNGAAGHAAWGSYYFDEEGWLAQGQTLLDAGRLCAPMTNLTSALRLGVPRTANGKRESWQNGVYTRQTNTYFSAGQSTLEQLMAQLGDGFLATRPAGGMEDPKGMGIQVGIQYLKEVKGGKLTGRVFKGPAGGDIQMTGHTPDVLRSIVAKSKVEFDSDSDDGGLHPINEPGGCGKYHKEFVEAGSGGPYMLFDNITLG